MKRWRLAEAVRATIVGAGLGALLGCGRGPSNRVEDAWLTVAGALRSGETTLCLSSLSISEAVSTTASTSNSEVLIAAASLEADYRASATPVSRLRAAAGRLAIGHYREAAALLEERASQDRSAAEWSDLAVARYQSFRATGSVRELVSSLDASARAVHLDPAIREGWHNLALAARELHLAKYAADSEVRAEGLPCGAAIRGAPVGPVFESLAAAADMREEARDLSIVTERFRRRHLMPWAQQLASSDQRRADSRTDVLAAARTVSTATGDPYWSALVQELGRQSVRGAAGFVAYADAVAATESEDFARAKAHLPRAVSAIDRRFPALWASVALERAAQLRLDGKPAEALAVLSEAIDVAEHHSFKRIVGRANWQLGLLLEETGRFGQAFTRHSTAERVLESAGDNEGAAVVKVRLARLYEQIGQRTRAWEFVSQALNALPSARRYRRDAILRGAASLAASEGLVGAALAFQAEPLEDARLERAAGGLAFLHPERAGYQTALGLSADAERSLAEASSWIQRIGDPQTAAMATAVHLRAAAAAHASSEPDRSLADLTGALQLYRARDSRFAVAEVQLSRARLLRRLHRDGEAEAALLDGIATLEGQRDAVRGAAARSRVVGRSWQTYRELADLLASRGDRRRAIDVIERGRSLSGHGGSEVTRPPASTAIVSYFLLPSTSFGLLRTDSGDKLFDLSLSADRIERAIDSYRAHLMHGRDAEADGVAPLLFDAMLAPIWPDLRSRTRIVVVPDAGVSSFEMAALTEPSTGRRLVDSHEIQYALTLAGPPRRNGVRRPETGVLVMTEARRRQDLGLADLPGAELEARLVAGLYPGAHLRLGAEANRATLIALAPSAAIIHFAGHALADATEPALSRLVVARAPGDDLGAVFESDIAELDLGGTRVVVLAACDTAREGQPAGPALFGLARSFLGAGAGAVVATLWPISDRASSEMVLALHRQLRDGVGVATALRRAKQAGLQQSRGRSALADLAAFVAIEAYPTS